MGGQLNRGAGRKRRALGHSNRQRATRFAVRQDSVTGGRRSSPPTRTCSRAPTSEPRQAWRSSWRPLV